MPEYIPTTKQIYRGRVEVIGQSHGSWTCGHEHLNLRDAQQCAETEIARREAESGRRERIRLPGIHADIVLEKLTKFAGSLDTDDGVEMTIVEAATATDASFGATIKLSSHAVPGLINALAEVAGLPYNP